MAILFFERDRDKYPWLSNFHPAPFCLGGVVYADVERFFQSQKPKARPQREEIIKAETPGLAKKLGRKCDLRADWEKVKDHIMRLGLYGKFSQHPDLRNQLIDTGQEQLIEDNPKDKYWGRYDKEGDNKLGLLLMELRGYLRIWRMLANTQMLRTGVFLFPANILPPNVEVDG